MVGVVVPEERVVLVVTATLGSQPNVVFSLASLVQAEVVMEDQGG